MTPGDVARLFAKANLFDSRFGDPSVAEMTAWFEVLHHLDVNDALQAVSRHYADSTDRIMPAHIRRGVKAIQAERRRNEPVPERALPSRFEADFNRDVCMERGAATVRGVLGPILETIAARQKQLPSAMDELRALTDGPDVVDAVIVAEEVFE